jgi:hypothetical protein
MLQRDVRLPGAKRWKAFSRSTACSLNFPTFDRRYRCSAAWPNTRQAAEPGKSGEITRALKFIVTNTPRSLYFRAASASSARARRASGLRDQLRRKPWPRWSTSWTSITSVARAILVNAPTLEVWYLLQGQAVAISRTTGIYALMSSGVSRRQGERREIGVARIECSRTHEQWKQ